MPRVFEEGTPEHEYILGAIRSGQFTWSELETILFLSKVTGTPVQEVNSKWMDVKIGIRQIANDPKTFEEKRG